MLAFNKSCGRIVEGLFYEKGRMKGDRRDHEKTFRFFCFRKYVTGFFALYTLSVEKQFSPGRRVKPHWINTRHNEQVIHRTGNLDSKGFNKSRSAKARKINAFTDRVTAVNIG